MTIRLKQKIKDRKQTQKGLPTTHVKQKRCVEDRIQVPLKKAKKLDQEIKKRKRAERRFENRKTNIDL